MRLRGKTISSSCKRDDRLPTTCGSTVNKKSLTYRTIEDRVGRACSPSPTTAMSEKASVHSETKSEETVAEQDGHPRRARWENRKLNYSMSLSSLID